MTVKNVLLLPNLDKVNSVECTNSAASRLAELGIVPLLEEVHAPYISAEGCRFGPFRELLDRCDLLLPIGGDGTILGCVGHAVAAGKPILGVNTGRVGFLTQLESTELEALAVVACAPLRLERRILLELELRDGTGAATTHTVLNDIVFAHEHGKLVDLVVDGDNRQIARHRANGLIFATPTGSTAYSLSAGGSIVDPTLSVVLLTPICPYSAYNRSFILPGDQSYTVHMEQGSALYITTDGAYVGQLRAEQTVTVRKSSRHVSFVDVGLRDFYSNLYEKLSLRR